jgi:hypothetical protein
MSLSSRHSGLTVIPRGFGGSEMSDVIYYAEKLILPYEPRAVLLYEGDNDIWSQKSPERIVSDLEFLVELCRASDPDLRFYVISIKPSLARWHLWGNALEANALMRDYCERTQNVTYIDVVPALLGDDGEPLEAAFLADGLHLNGVGYDLWSETIYSALLNYEVRRESLVGCINCREPIPGDTFRVDFGSESIITEGENEVWNNLTAYVVAESAVISLSTDNGDQVALALRVSEDFSGIMTAWVNAVASFPETVISDSFWVGSYSGHSAALLEKGAVEISGLPREYVYRVSILGSRANNDGGSGRKTIYTVQGESVEVEVAFNPGALAVFDEVVPDRDGKIHIEVSVAPDSSSRFSHLNALVLRVNDEGEAIVPKWGPFIVQDDGRVNSDSALGVLMIEHSPWIVSEAFGRWVYARGADWNQVGGWVYVPRM